jgi:ParB/RepB/Spo0J family partition protein
MHSALTTQGWKMIGIDLIQVDGDRLRAIQPDTVARLAESIATHGLLHPLVVEPASEGEAYRLIAGARRLAALRHLGWREAPACVVELGETSRRLSLAIVENVQRSNLTVEERRQAYGKLRQLLGSTNTAAATLGLHPASFRRTLRDSSSDGRAARRISFGQSINVLQRWTEAAKELAPDKREVLLQHAQALVAALHQAPLSE